MSYCLLPSFTFVIFIYSSGHFFSPVRCRIRSVRASAKCPFFHGAPPATSERDQQKNVTATRSNLAKKIQRTIENWRGAKKNHRNNNNNYRTRDTSIDTWSSSKSPALNYAALSIDDRHGSTYIKVERVAKPHQIRDVCKSRYLHFFS